MSWHINNNISISLQLSIRLYFNKKVNPSTPVKQDVPIFFLQYSFYIHTHPSAFNIARVNVKPPPTLSSFSSMQTPLLLCYYRVNWTPPTHLLTLLWKSDRCTYTLNHVIFRWIGSAENCGRRFQRRAGHPAVHGDYISVYLDGWSHLCIPWWQGGLISVYLDGWPQRRVLRVVFQHWVYDDNDDVPVRQDLLRLIRLRQSTR